MAIKTNKQLIKAINKKMSEVISEYQSLILIDETYNVRYKDRWRPSLNKALAWKDDFISKISDNDVDNWLLVFKDRDVILQAVFIGRLFIGDNKDIDIDYIKENFGNLDLILKSEFL